MASIPVNIGDFKDAKGNWFQSGAQAYYAAKYFQAIEDTNYWRNIIAGVQSATQIYFADKQHTIATRQNEIATQQQNRLDNISNIELARSGEVYGQWVKGITCEDAQLLEACGMLVDKPDINDIRRMVAADVKRAFAPAKRQIRECYAPSCADAMCSELNKTAREEARILVAVTTQTYLKQVQIYEMRLATVKSWRYQVLAFGRGSIQASTALMQGAAQAAQAASQITTVNPYSGYIQATNGIFNTARSMSLQEANGYRGMGINMRQQIANPASGATQVTGLDYQNQMDIQSDNYTNLNSRNSFDIQDDAYGQTPTGMPSNGGSGDILYDRNGLQDNTFLGGIPTG